MSISLELVNIVLCVIYVDYVWISFVEEISWLFYGWCDVCDIYRLFYIMVENLLFKLYYSVCMVGWELFYYMCRGCLLDKEDILGWYGKVCKFISYNFIYLVCYVKCDVLFFYF